MTKRLSFFFSPYLYSVVFLVLYFFAHSWEALCFSLVSFTLTSVCLMLLKSAHKSQLFSASEKASKLIFFISSLFCAFIFVLNLISGSVKMWSLLFFLISFLYFLFPHTLSVFSDLIYHNALVSLKKNKITINSEDALSDIKESKIIIINDFDSYSHPECITSLAEKKLVILTSHSSKEKLILKYGEIFKKASFAGSKITLPLPEKGIIVSISDSEEVLRLVRLINMPYFVLDETATLEEKDFSLVEKLCDTAVLMYAKYNKCLMYKAAVNLSLLLSVFLLVFSCSLIPLTPLMLVFLCLITEIPAGILFVYGKADLTPQSKTKMLLNSLLLSLTGFIVCMSGAISFSAPCARLIFFNASAFSFLLYSFNLQSGESIFLFDLLKKPWAIITFFSGLLLSVLISYLIYHESTTFGAKGWILVLTISLVPFCVIELQKAATSLYKKSE